MGRAEIVHEREVFDMTSSELSEQIKMSLTLKRYLVFKGFISPMEGLGDACDKLNTIKEVKNYLQDWNKSEDGFDWVSVIDLYTGKEINKELK